MTAQAGKAGEKEKHSRTAGRNELAPSVWKSESRFLKNLKLESEHDPDLPHHSWWILDRHNTDDTYMSVLLSAVTNCGSTSQNNPISPSADG